MPLEDHRLLGGDGMAALLAPDGAIEWWCTPRLDASPVFWRLLDERGGSASWRDAKPIRSVGGPVGACARTVVEVDGEHVCCWDGLLRIDGEPTIVRLVRAVRGRVELTHELVAAVFDPTAPSDAHLVRAESSDGAHRAGGTGVVQTTIVARPDRWRALTLRRGAARTPALGPEVLERLLRASEHAAEDVARGSGVVTAHRDRVVASLLVLDACSEASTGAVAASPTTSVPEVLGADRQFDYRFAWIRDASLAAAIAALLGRPSATRHHVDWLVRRCIECEGVPTPVTSLGGDAVPDEREVANVAGLAGSRPVRVGNAAKDQVQLDGSGFVAEAVWMLAATGGGLDRRGYRAVVDLAEQAVRLEPVPTNGIWEQREPDRFTSADVGLWLLFDRALRLRVLHQPWAWRRRHRWRAGLAAARERVLGALLSSGALPLTYDTTDVDATGLLLVVLGLLGGDDPRAARLVDATLAALGMGDPIVALRRYPPCVDAGFDGTEAAFVPVSWWAVSALALIGRRGDAHELADRLCEATPGLQPEMLDPDGAVGLGNTPLVWSHAECARALFLVRMADIRARWGLVGARAWQAHRFLRQVRSQRRGRTDSDQ